MTTAVRAFLVGTVVTGLLVFVLAAALGVASASARLELDVRAGPLRVVAVEREGADVATTIGPGIALVGVCGGLANVGGAAILARRRRKERAVA